MPAWGTVGGGINGHDGWDLGTSLVCPSPRPESFMVRICAFVPCPAIGQEWLHPPDQLCSTGELQVLVKAPPRQMPVGGVNQNIWECGWGNTLSPCGWGTGEVRAGILQMLGALFLTVPLNQLLSPSKYATCNASHTGVWPLFCHSPPQTPKATLAVL